MNSRLVLALLLSLCVLRAEDEFPLTEDSKPHDGIAKGELIKGNYTAKDGSLFPGTGREYAIYLPANLDKTQPAPFMVFQDGVIYNAPTVFDNLIAKKDIPAMIGIFIKPGVVPAANDNALPRYNRSYEYDSVTDSYARFLIDEFLPAIVATHGLNLSNDPNARGITGNSSGGICAFMVAWHRPDAFRRVFTGVGTYVGIHGADQLPVLVRKFEPKPLRVVLQSGENDNNLYCGDWWLANQMMERSLSWNGYEVNHAWGTSSHNAKQASQIFPEVLRWLWKGFPNEPVKANPLGDAKWKGYEVIGDGEWKAVTPEVPIEQRRRIFDSLASDTKGNVYFGYGSPDSLWLIRASGNVEPYAWEIAGAHGLRHLVLDKKAQPVAAFDYVAMNPAIGTVKADGSLQDTKPIRAMTFEFGESGMMFSVQRPIPQTPTTSLTLGGLDDDGLQLIASRADGSRIAKVSLNWLSEVNALCLSPDQTQLYMASRNYPFIWAVRVQALPELEQSRYPMFVECMFGELEAMISARLEAVSLCVDTNGWLYVATSLGIQVLDQAGRVNFIIRTPKPPRAMCFGGKDLSDLFIACGDAIYKRPTKAHGYISGQMAPIKPPAPKL